MKKLTSGLILVAFLGILPMTAIAGERKDADIACDPTGQRLVYDCSVMLTERRSGDPISGAEFSVGADMPSMPGAHNVKPVPAIPHDEPGLYGARIELDMPGEWAIRLDFTKPNRDRVVKKLYFSGNGDH
ncbi:MAG: FixH family protein [Albidovulum sp.]|nr:FixH family protein [Albidovulum sp.]